MPQIQALHLCSGAGCVAAGALPLGVALREALGRPGGPERFAALRQATEDFAAGQRNRDPLALLTAEEEFHAALCRASGNLPLLALWSSLARQLVVVWGLGHGVAGMPGALEQHQALLAALEQADFNAAAALLAEHLEAKAGFDFEAAVAERRRA